MAPDEPYDGEGRRPERAVAVFGASDSPPESREYRDAYEVGLLLAIAGIAVVNGGYGGVMEASARGAREAGGRPIGVTTRAFGARRSANRYIETEHSEDDLFLRTRRLIETARAFIILPGKAGTLAELAFLWALQKADLLGPKPILLLGKVWEDLVQVLRTANLLEEEAAAATRVAGSPQEAVEAVTRSLQGTR